MKKIILTLSALLLINIAFAQENLSVTICDITSTEVKTEKSLHNSITISQSKLLECLEINSNLKGFKIVSFSLGMTAGKDFIELNTKGNTLNERMITIIKKYNPEKIYIEKIVLENKSGEASRLPALTLNIK